MDACMYACTQVYVNVHTPTHTHDVRYIYMQMCHTYMDTSMYKHKRLLMNTHTYTDNTDTYTDDTYIDTDTDTHAYTHKRMHTHTHTHTHAHTYTQSYTHTHKPACHTQKPARAHSHTLTLVFPQRYIHMYMIYTVHTCCVHNVCEQYHFHTRAYMQTSHTYMHAKVCAHMHMYACTHVQWHAHQRTYTRMSMYMQVHTHA